MDKINVDLYGGTCFIGGRELRTEADEIYCDCYNKCSLYADNKCLRCRSLGASTCQFGKNVIVVGYTSRSRKYYDFKNKYRLDNVYHKLNHPEYEKVALINDTLYINTIYVSIFKPSEEEKQSLSPNEYSIIGDYWIDNSSGKIRNCVAFIPIEECTVPLLGTIFSQQPKDFYGNGINDYSDNVIPDIMMGIKKYVPEIYNALIKEYPQFDLNPKYVGKYAYLNTLADGAVIKDCHNNTFTFKDGLIHGENIANGFTPFDGVILNCMVKVNDDYTIRITDNNQCNENTKFK